MAKGDHIKYRSGYKYQLAETYDCKTSIYPPMDVLTPFYCIYQDGVVVAKAGYAWDGASGPTFDTKNSMRGSLIHDVLCQAISEGLLDKRFKPAADAELKKILIEDGMWRWRACSWFWGVDTFGGPWGMFHKDNVKEAP